jgi:hypothetical protein
MAFIFATCWALYYRLWKISSALLALNCVIAIISSKLHLPSEFLMIGQLVLNLSIGFYANDWRRENLQENGYQLVDIVSGLNRMDAVRRFFDRNINREESVVS